MAKDTQLIELKPIVPTTIVVTIVSDSDICLNKMNNVTVRELTDIRNAKAKSLEKPNKWEEIITSIHWLKGDPKEFSEKTLKDALKNNAPCITCFGLKKSFGQAVTRNKIDQYSTKFDAAVNVVGEGNGLVPIKFTNYYLTEKLMSPKRGKPILSRLNNFSGWSADIKISLTDNVYSVEQLINIINLAGFGIGIGSGRPSGFGRYHVADVKMI